MCVCVCACIHANLRCDAVGNATLEGKKMQKKEIDGENHSVKLDNVFVCGWLWIFLLLDAAAI